MTKWGRGARVSLGAPKDSWARRLAALRANRIVSRGYVIGHWALVIHWTLVIPRAATLQLELRAAARPPSSRAAAHTRVAGGPSTDKPPAWCKVLEFGS